MIASGCLSQILPVAMFPAFRLPACLYTALTFAGKQQ
jgi:hypothetical protein